MTTQVVVLHLTALSGVLHSVVYYIQWCTTSSGVLRPVVYYIRWCTTSSGVLHPVVYYICGVLVLLDGHKKKDIR